MRTIRPRPGPGAWAAIAILAGMFIAAAVYRPGQALGLLAGAVLVVVIGWVRVRAVRLEITDSTVRVKQGRFLPEKEAARSDITVRLARARLFKPAIGIELALSAWESVGSGRERGLTCGATGP
jgi:hypothetical protein